MQNSPMPSKLLFLSGALGRVDFWLAAAERMRHPALHIVEGADHDLAYTHAAQVAALIDRHLGASNP